MERKRKMSMLGLAATALLTVLLSVSLLIQSNPQSIVVFAVGSVPDAYGNQIAGVVFYQNGTGDWGAASAIYGSWYAAYYNYSSGISVTLSSNQHTYISIDVLLNLTFASSLLDAYTKARGYINITGVASQAALTACLSLGGSVGAYWHLYFAYPSYPPGGGATTWIPAASTSYSISIQYQAYY